MNAEGLLEQPCLRQHGQVIAVVGDLNRAVLAEAGRQARRRVQFRHELRVAAQRVLAEPEDLALGVGGLGDRREHASGGVRGPKPWLGIG